MLTEQRQELIQQIEEKAKQIQEQIDNEIEQKQIELSALREQKQILIEKQKQIEEKEREQKKAETENTIGIKVYMSKEIYDILEEKSGHMQISPFIVSILRNHFQSYKSVNKALKDTKKQTKHCVYIRIEQHLLEMIDKNRSRMPRNTFIVIILKQHILQHFLQEA